MTQNTPDNLDVTPRDLRFDVTGASKGYWMGGDPVGTAVFNALSLTFPDGERLFMDAVRLHRSHASGKLAEDVKGFIAQEAIHSREHHQLNLLIDRERYPAEKIEAMVRGRVTFARERGPTAMLVSTICLEHFTAMMADMFMDDEQLFEGTAPELARMWRWHAMEETEHKAVAYDVFMAATRDWKPWQRYMRRCMAMAIISVIFTRNIRNYAALLLQADGYSPKEAQKAAGRYLWARPGLFTRGWKTYFSWYRPGFHPWQHDNRAELAAWQAEFAAPAAA